MTDPHTTVHNAIDSLLDEGEIAISWVLTIDIAGPDDTRYLAHRSGGGHNGTEGPMAWAALGMLRASVILAEDQLRDMTSDEPPSHTDDDE